MKKLLLIFLLIISPLSIAKDTVKDWLNGSVSTFDLVGKKIPWSGNVIKISYEREKYRTATKTNNKGDFHLFIKKPIVLGTKVTLSIDEDDYFILAPFNGEFYPPRDLTNFELHIIVVSNSSKVVQVGPLYASFSNQDISKKNQKQMYTVQVVSTTSNLKAAATRDFFRRRGYDSFVDTLKQNFGLAIYKVYVTTSTDWATTNKVKNTIRKGFKRKYKDAFVKSVLIPIKSNK